MSGNFAKQAAKCFVGAWGFINATLVNTTTGDTLPGNTVPSGLSLYTPNGWVALLVTPNDTTQPKLRPRNLVQTDLSSGTDEEWALIGKYSIAGAGPYHLSNVTSGNDSSSSCTKGDKASVDGPQGTVTGSFVTATLPSREGPYEFTFKFYDSCRVWNLHQPLGGDLERVAWYYKLPDQDVY